MFYSGGSRVLLTFVTRGSNNLMKYVPPKAISIRCFYPYLLLKPGSMCVVATAGNTREEHVLAILLRRKGCERTDVDGQLPATWDKIFLTG
jgi:hypothetical protein